MNSSESEEDFESADEDIDPEIPSESNDEDENVRKVVNIEKNHEESSSLGTTSIKVLDKLNQVDFEEPIAYRNKGITKIEASPDEASQSEKVDDTFNTKETKTEPSVNKLPTNETNLSTNESSLQPKKEHSKPEHQNVKNNKDRKIKPTKLGMKLTTSEVKDIFDVGDNMKAIVDGNKDVKFDEFVESYETSNNSTERVEAICIDKSSQNIPKQTEDMKFGVGDGWELEEEDGFEIPVTLAKTGDGGIQCSQEQICEMDQVQFRPSKTEQEPSWGGWGGWGVSSLLSTASGTVTTFSSHVTAGLSTVLETTVGAPDPETLAGEHVSRCEIKEESTRNDDKTDPGYGGLVSIMSGVSFLGSSVINRGLDTLETIGKKTMEVLQEGDPGLKKKRAMLFQDQDKPILSQILREAKEKADSSDKEKEEKESARKVHFESLFDDFQGLVHLEALEMLSTQCDLKLQSLLQSYSGTQLVDLQETLSQVRDLCELADEEEDAEVLPAEQFAEKITDCVEGLRIKIIPSKVLKVNNEICERLEQLGPESATVVNQSAISSLAELTAAAMECFHKSAELVMAKSIHNTADEAESFVRLTNHLCARLTAVSSEFTQLLTKRDPISNSSLITNIFLEASNSCSYVKNACQLLVPILQVGAVATYDAS